MRVPPPTLTQALAHRGSVLVLFVMILPIMLGFTALSLDVARMLLAKQELQHAADAAALAGAAALDDPGGPVPYNWDAASLQASGFINKNPVSGRQITDGDIQVGYVQPGDPLKTVHSPLEASAVDPFSIPVVRVSLSLGVGKNGGPLPLLFGAFLGSPEKSLDGVAMAAAYPPGHAAPGSLFPVVIGRCMYDLFWDASARRPKNDPVTGKPYQIQIGANYGGGNCLSGAWSTFNTQLNDVPAVQALITGGNPVAIRLGDTTYVQSGVKDSIYNSVPSGKVVAVPVVQQVNPGNFQTVVAIAAFQITGVDKVDGKSFIQGQFVHGLKVAGLSAGNGGGQDLGAQNGFPSILIQ